MVIRLPELEYADFSIADVPSRPEPFRLINRIPIVDNGEPLVDLRETNPEFSFASYCLPYVRASVAEGLRAAWRNLPDHLDLRIFTALRTLEQQAEMYWGNYRRCKEEHPNWPESVVRKMTNRFFAPPDAKAPPGHCTGGAVDVGLFSRDSGEGLDVRSPLEGWNGAPTAVPGLSPEASENRRLLCFIMFSTGLSNCRDEFWHWSYGDSAWAVRVEAKVACYGLIEPPTDATRVVGNRIQLSSYREEWAVKFEEIRRELASLLGPFAARIEHIGSTAVPGLTANPEVDIDIVVKNPDAMNSVIEALEAFGYEHKTDHEVADRTAFQAKSGDPWKDAPWANWHAHSLNAWIENSNELRRRLAFRDYLRSNDAAVTEFADLKSRLANRFPWDRIRYGAAKEPFIVEILRKIDPNLL
jgi:D-alanyl-D-alanine dipeptidase